MTDDDRIDALEARLRAMDSQEAEARRATDRAMVATELATLGHSAPTSSAVAALLVEDGGPIRREGGALVFDGAPSLRDGLQRFIRTQWDNDAPEQPQAPARSRGARLMAALREAFPAPMMRPTERGAALFAAVKGGAR